MYKKKKILTVFGTRPEAIKMCPLIKQLHVNDEFEAKICVTGQHREMLNQVLKIFEIVPDYDLHLMKKDQDLYQLTSRIILSMKQVLDDFEPDIVLLQGDTTTTLMSALAAFYSQICVGHIEAGLRTGDIYSPWPEEANRRLTSQIATFHFAPTEISKKNLIRENVNEDRIVVTGNTVIDALYWVLDKIRKNKSLEENIRHKLRSAISQSTSTADFTFSGKRKLVLITGHRRESFGQGFLSMCQALKQLAIENPDVDFVYPVHLNPNVQKPVFSILSDISNFYLIEPLDYEPFVYLMNLSHFILTDSGGIQEEAPSLGKPVLVMRNTTERPEGVDSGTVRLVGTDQKKIYDESMRLLHNPLEYRDMAKAHNPYGDGKACVKIVNFLKEKKNEY
jgi:UDP-N-acetylglucosamine 2-epimerase (non-hydrolysing)